MPKQTFLNLTKEKQDHLLKVAREEFSNNLFNDVSINKIIQKCEISRGSFYTYFEDKKDIYDFLVKKTHENVFNKLKKVIKNNKGDITCSFIELFDEIIVNVNEDNLFLQKMFLNAHNNNDYQLHSKNKCSGKDNMIEDILKLINTDKIKKEIDVRLLFKLHFMLLIQNIAHHIKKLEPTEQIKKEYIQQLRIIEMGYKEEL
jgi:AcrR family transcriptional regulator